MINVILTGGSMSETTIALDAGHGGSDPGAAYKGRQEKNDTLRLVQAVGKILEDAGVNVIFTRTGDIYETPFKKATDANHAGADYFVSIHRNSSEIPNQYNGVQTLVYSDSGIKAEMARNINKELENLGFKNLGVSERPNLVVLKRTRMPAILIEAGFINSDEDNALFDQQFQQIAQGIADGILTTIFNQSSGNSRITSIEEVSHSIESFVNNEEVFNTETMPPFSNEEDPSDFPDIDRYYNERRDSDINERRGSDMNRWDNMSQSNMSQSNMNQNTDYNSNNNNNYCANEPLYRVQVGAYRNKDNADRMLNSLLMEGFPAFIILEDGLYKVQVGAFRYLANAVKMENRLRRFRYNTFIVYA